MSEQQPPRNNDQNRDPGKQGGPSGPNASGSPNWGVWIMLTLIVLVLVVSLSGSFGFGEKEMTLSQFEQLYKSGRVITSEPKRAPLEIVMSDSSPDGLIRGFRFKDDLTAQTAYEPFTMAFTSDLIDDKFKKRLEEVGARLSAPQEYVPPAVARQSVTWDRFPSLVAQGMIKGEREGIPPVLSYSDGQFYLDGRIVTRTWPSLEDKANRAKIEPFTVRFNIPFDKERVDSMIGDVAAKTTESSMWKTILFNFLPILLIIGIIFFMFRAQTGGGAKGAMSFGKSRAKLMSPDKNKVTFKDVAGVTEAKEEVWELVEFLRNPKKFRDLGGMIPKGVLMVGPPGTGKTLLARAIAGEADVPFYSISGSDFVEMFVGVGASRVRDMFEQAKKSAPCIIFIDEIDAVGRHRGYGVGGSHDEREQTLNALLVEMDGFDATQNVIVIAATNRPDVLDPALLRPGRFDREVTVDLPDVKGREQILMVHSKKVKMDKNVDMKPIARGTPGFSGAELANLINEAALLAARKGLKAVTNEELEAARDKVRWGKERKSLAINDKEKRITAVHEAGHAICLLRTDSTDPLHKVTIIPRGPSLGSTMWLPEEDKYHMHKSEMLDTLVVAMGGRCAEEIVFGDVTSGASGDIRMASNVARRMVCQFGMSEKLGMVEYGESSGEVFLARDLGTRSRNYSESTAQLIDQEVKDIIDQAYSRSKAILLEHRERLDAIADALMEYETLNGEQVRDILDKGQMEKPPVRVGPPPLPGEEKPQGAEVSPVIKQDGAGNVTEDL